MTPLSLMLSRFVPLSRRLRLVSRCAVVALVLVAALTMSSGLAACSGAGAATGATASGAAGASARPTGSGAASPSPSALPTLSPELAALREEALGTVKPEPPAVMSEDSPAAAAVTATYFISLYRYALLTGDVAALEELSEAECVFCASVIEKARRYRDAGEWIEPWDLTVIDGAVRPDARNGYVGVDLDIDSEAMTRRRSDGSLAAEATAEHITLTVVLAHASGTWRVREAEVTG